MAKKKESNEKKAESMFAKLAGELISGVFIKKLREQAKGFGEDLMDNVKTGVMKTVKSIGQFVFSGVVLIIGVIFLLISLVLLLVEHMKISLGLSFLLWGLILLVVGLVYQMSISKK